MPTDFEGIFAKIADAMNRRDYDAFEHLFTDDYVEEYPQSGEVVHGASNARAIRENYPGGGVTEQAVEAATTRIGATDACWVRPPAFTLIHAEGTGNIGTATFRNRYPDGSIWWIINLVEMRGDRIARATMFFAPVFEAPEWRKPYVEPRKAAGGA